MIGIWDDVPNKERTIIVFFVVVGTVSVIVINCF